MVVFAFVVVTVGVAAVMVGVALAVARVCAVKTAALRILRGQKPAWKNTWVHATRHSGAMA